MDKQALQAKVNELELTLNSLELNAKATKDDLKEATKKLKDISKPTITNELLENIQYAIDEAIRNSSLSEVDSYEVDFEICHNNSLALESIEFNYADQLSAEIAEGVEDLFNVIEN